MIDIEPVAIRSLKSVEENGSPRFSQLQNRLQSARRRSTILGEVEKVGEEQPVYPSLACIDADHFRTIAAQEFCPDVSARKKFHHLHPVTIGREKDDSYALRCKRFREETDGIDNIRHTPKGVRLKWTGKAPTTRKHLAPGFIQKLARSFPNMRGGQTQMQATFVRDVVRVLQVLFAELGATPFVPSRRSRNMDRSRTLQFIQT